MLTFKCNAQGYSVEQLKKGILAKYNKQPDSLDICSMVIIDGVPIESSDIESGKKVISKEETKVFVLGDLTNLPHSKCDYVLVLGKGQYQKKKEKRQLLKLAKRNVDSFILSIELKDSRCDSCIAIVVNGNLLPEQESKKLIKSLKVNEVSYIYFYETPNPTFYGYRAKNGLMEIYLKNNN